MEDDVRLWRCENGHILGEIGRNGSRRPHLRVYRYAVRDGQAGVEGSLVTAAGYAEVRCSICGAVRRWFPEVEEGIKQG